MTLIAYEVSGSYSNIAKEMTKLNYSQFWNTGSKIYHLPYNSLFKYTETYEAEKDLKYVIETINSTCSKKDAIILHKCEFYEEKDIKRLIQPDNNSVIYQPRVIECNDNYIKDTTFMNRMPYIQQDTKTIIKSEAVNFAKWLQHTDNGTLHYNPHTKEVSDSIGYSPLDCFIDEVYPIEELYDKWLIIKQTKSKNHG